jgi:3-deoxy-D-manno-octulosonate 8-phosphate phosphatase (KDO 8-P phosphatase)
VGFAATVPDAIAPVIARADWVATRQGGHGAVRECCDFILAHRP